MFHLLVNRNVLVCNCQFWNLYPAVIYVCGFGLSLTTVNLSVFVWCVRCCLHCLTDIAIELLYVNQPFLEFEDARMGETCYYGGVCDANKVYWYHISKPKVMKVFVEKDVLPFCRDVLKIIIQYLTRKMTWFRWYICMALLIEKGYAHGLLEKRVWPSLLVRVWNYLEEQVQGGH